MAREPIKAFSDSDIRFLVETVAPELLDKLETVKSDPDIVGGMLEHETHQLLQRIMLMNQEMIMTAITPRFLFEVLLRIARKELKNRAYTVERTATQKVPVFDSQEVVDFLENDEIIRYLSDMLTSFTRIESFTIPVRVRKGIWRRIRFNDMDLDSLTRFCQTVDEENRFSFYKRIADLCLFILGMFPEYVVMDYRYPSGKKGRPRFFGKWRKSIENYEEEGRRFYMLAGNHDDAAILNLNDVLYQLHDKFNLAKKPLNYISANLLQFKRDKLFLSLPS